MSELSSNEPNRRTWRARLAGRAAGWTPLAALVGLIAFTVAYEFWRKGRSNFVSPENLLNILRQWSFVGIIAVGMTFVIVLGGIDLSVGSLVAFLGGAGILVMNRLLVGGVSEFAAVLAAFGSMLIGGIVAGAINGLLVTRGRLAPFIATLGGLAAYRSLALALVDGGEYRSLSAEIFPAIGAGGIPLGFLWRDHLLGLWIVPGKLPLMFPWPVVAFLGVAAAAAVLLNLTRFGRYVIAIGSNERAAIYSAIPVARIKLLTYALLGLCTGLAALLLGSRMNSVSSSGTGLLYELDVIAAVVIGGTRMRGGAGTIFGTVVGVLILGVIGNMLNLLQVSVYYQGLIKGLIIVGAVMLQRGERA